MLGAIALASGTLRAASPGEEAPCAARRPVASLPRNYSPLLAETRIPCRDVEDVASRLALLAQPVVSAPVTKVRPLVKPRLVYYGGPVLSSVRVYAVRWNSTVPADFSTRAEAFYRTFVAGAMFDWLGEYDTVGLTGALDGFPGSGQRISHGSFGGTFTLTPTNRATVLSETAVIAELRAALQSGALPAPDRDAQGVVNALYLVNFPENIVLKDANIQSCRDYCAYHDSFPYGGADVPFAVLPAIAGGCLYGCGNHQDPFDIATSNASHELVESVTDPAVGATSRLERPVAWTDENQGEIADICENGPDEMLDGYWVARQWSNRWKACVVAPPPNTLP